MSDQNPTDPIPFATQLSLAAGTYTVRARTKNGLHVEHTFVVGAELAPAEPITLRLAK